MLVNVWVIIVVGSGIVWLNISKWFGFDGLSIVWISLDELFGQVQIDNECYMVGSGVKDRIVPEGLSSDGVSVKGLYFSCFAQLCYGASDV